MANRQPDRDLRCLSGWANHFYAYLVLYGPANVIAVGNPCRVLREITERDREYYYKEQRFDEVEW